ncbi:MAG: L-threonylcarbamoyladenylate synthase [Candidatus Micrarchaeota archaeon]
MVLILDSKTAMAIEEAVKVLQNEGVIVYPTDTLYGIGGDGTSEISVKKIYKIKKSNQKKPLSVMMADMNMVKEYCVIEPEQEKELLKKLPGPYTFLLNSKKKIAASNGKKLGIRIPDEGFCQFLCKRFGKPIVTTSANITKQKPPTTIEEVDNKILRTVGLAIDGGKTKYQRPSEIIDLVNGKKIR